MIGEGLYECGSCGHQWSPGEVFADIDAIVCEICGMFDTFVKEVRSGYHRGAAAATQRDGRVRAAAQQVTRRKALRLRRVQEQEQARRTADEQRRLARWEEELSLRGREVQWEEKQERLRELDDLMSDWDGADAD